MISQAQIYALGVVCVAGWEFLVFTYPDWVCRLSSKKHPTPKRLKLIDTTGAVASSMVFIGSISGAIFVFYRTVPVPSAAFPCQSANADDILT
jgi:hypothetical protein